jgi:hypothetical protein
MSDRIYVATRKGLFAVDRVGRGSWSVTRTAFLGDKVTMTLRDSRDNTLYAALNLGHFGVKLHRSDDEGQSWTELQAPRYQQLSDEQIDATPASPSVEQVWTLEAGGPEEPGVLWAGTIPGGLFRSTDRGESWRLIETLWNRPERENWFGGGYDQPGIHSICVDPRDSSHLTLGVSCGGVWITRDAGRTWSCSTTGMYAEYMPPERREDPTIQDPHRIVQCAADPDTMWVQHHNGVFRSADGGMTWQDIPAAEPSTFGFAVAVHPRQPDTAWLVPAIKDQCRIPVDGKFVVSRTRDGGKSFEVLRRGLPQEHSYDLVYRHALDVDETGDHLALGSTTGGLWVSEDGGDGWTSISSSLPPIYQVLFAG